MNILPLFDSLGSLQESVFLPDFPYPEDYQQGLKFLQSYRGSEATFNAYRREIERLLQWCQHIAHKSLKELKREDVEAYLQFCQSPPEKWIGLKKCDRFIERDGERIPNPAWRPFVLTIPKIKRFATVAPTKADYQLSQKGLQAIFAILGSFYQYLIEENQVNYNPIAGIRQKSKFIRKNQQQAPVRRLSELQWQYVMNTVQSMAMSDPQRHERTLFMLSLLYGLYLRISELVATPRWEPQMGHFSRDSDGNWWFTTVGKGNKQRLIAVSDALLQALKRYRQFLGLPPLPTKGETTPLLSKERGKGPLTSTRQIRVIIQDCFDQTCSRLEQDGFLEDSAELQAATVHWLRHTGISEDVKIRPREHVRDDAGHSSGAITDRYIDVELRARHASSKKKKLLSTDDE